MNIVNKLTLRLLRKNKRRTLVTIIGVIISVAMLTAVATIGVSFIDLFKRQTIADEGEWHVQYEHATKNQIETIRNDKDTKSLSLSNNLGYALLDGSKNENKPYLFVKQYNKEGLQHFPINVTKGRLPKSEQEIVVSDHIVENGKVEYKIGDELKLEVGDRIADDKEVHNPLNQSDSLQVDDNENLQENLKNTSEKSYTVVGIIERPLWEPVWSPGYTAITYLDESKLTASNMVDVSVILKKIKSSIYKDTERFAKKNNIASFNIHDSLLRYYGVISDDFMRNTLYTLSAIIMAIIIIGSVSLIYNAFAISVAERSRYLGMLSSVGATRQQKRNSVFFEGLIIALISIPLGIITGFIGIGITFLFINSMIQNSFGITEKLKLTVTLGTIIVSVLVSLITIFISTYIPARRASKITAIDAIRQSQDVKLSRKKVKTSRFVRKLFGLEAEIGLKNLKRNKRKYQATVFSIVISIILFLSVTYFTDNMKKSTEFIQSSYNYDISIMLGYDDDESFIKSIINQDEITKTNIMIKSTDLGTLIDEDKVTELLRQDCTKNDNGKCPYTINMYALDESHLKKYAKQIDIDFESLQNDNSAIVIDTFNYLDDETNKRIEAKTIHTKIGEKLDVSAYDWAEDEYSYIDNVTVAGLTSKLPMGMDSPNRFDLNIVVSDKTFQNLGKGALLTLSHDKFLYLNSDDPIKTHEDIEETEEIKHSIQNFYKYRQEDEQLIMLLSVFTYGFIALITAISIANILNTISTSISLRTREFAMLKSVGMTPKGFNKMINYESIFYGIKALLYGLPISIGIMFLMYRAFAGSFDYSFTLPWLSILYVIVAVFLIVGTSMLYSSSKVKKQNIIEALKQENI